MVFSSRRDPGRNRCRLQGPADTPAERPGAAYPSPPLKGRPGRHDSRQWSGPGSSPCGCDHGQAGGGTGRCPRGRRQPLDLLFLEVGARGFPAERTAIRDAAPSERYDCAGGATSRAKSPPARTCQHIAASGVIPAHEVSLDRVLPEQHRHRIVNVNRRNVTMCIHALQSLNQSLLECVGHLAFQLMPPERLRKGEWTRTVRACRPKLRQFPALAPLRPAR